MILMFLLPIHLHAAPVGSGKIVGLTTYTTFGDGDVVFKLSTPVVGCDDGYWLNKKDPGFDTTLSVILSSFHAKTDVKVWGHDDQLWGGSGDSKYCRLNWLRLGS